MVAVHYEAETLPKNGPPNTSKAELCTEERTIMSRWHPGIASPSIKPKLEQNYSLHHTSAGASVAWGYFVLTASNL